MGRINEFERRLSDYIVEHDMEYQDVAAQLGITYTSLYKKRLGRMPFTFSEARKLAEMFGISMEQLYMIVPRPNRKGKKRVID